MTDEDPQVTEMRSALFERLEMSRLLVTLQARIEELISERDRLRHTVLRQTNEIRGLYAKLEQRDHDR